MQFWSHSCKFGWRETGVLKAVEVVQLNAFDVEIRYEYDQRPTKTKLVSKSKNVPDFRPVSFEMVDDIERKEEDKSH